MSFAIQETTQNVGDERSKKVFPRLAGFPDTINFGHIDEINSLWSHFSSYLLQITCSFSVIYLHTIPTSVKWVSAQSLFYSNRMRLGGRLLGRQ